MASIRRTLSPANHERHLQRSSSNHHPSSSSSAFSVSSSSSPSPHLLQRILMGGIVGLGPQSQRPLTRKWAQQQLAWNRSLLRFLLCFFIGFLLGFSPFYGLDDHGFNLGDFSFDENPIRSPPSVTLTLANSHSQLNPMLEAVKKDDMDSSKGKISGDDGDSTPLPPPRKLLIVVTPTYNRAFQSYYLSRLGQTLRLVPQPLLWIVVEMESASLETAELLRGTGVMYRHLVCERNSTSIKDRGVHQRNTALQHIEQHRMDGVVYFADDDNVYSLELFERLREIRRFGTWPVAMLAESKNKATLEGPVCNGSQIIGWHTNEKSKRLRRFHVDMSGFGFNSTILWDLKRWRRPTVAPIRQLDTVKEGFQETTFMEQVVEDEYQMEGLPSGCTKIMNWHLHLETKDYLYPTRWRISRNLDVVIPLK